jgi:hypothetical protein
VSAPKPPAAKLDQDDAPGPVVTGRVATLARAGVIVLEPGLLAEERAGEFLDRSTAWLRMMRQTDLALIARGEAPAGPAWVVINRSVFYRPDDLRDWISANAVVRAKVDFDKRRPSPTR